MYKHESRTASVNKPVYWMFTCGAPEYQWPQPLWSKTMKMTKRMGSRFLLGLASGIGLGFGITAIFIAMGPFVVWSTMDTFLDEAPPEHIGVTRVDVVSKDKVLVEIVNNADRPVDNIHLDVDCFDAEDAFVGEGTSYVDEILKPHESCRIMILSDAELHGVGAFKTCKVKVTQVSYHKSP